MAAVQKSPGGSIVLKVLIAILIVVLGYTIWFPKQQWQQQARDLKTAQLRLENLHNAGSLFVYFNKRYPHSIDEIVSALDTTFIDAEPVHFEIEVKMNMDLMAEREDLLRVEFRTEEDEQRLTQLQALIRDSLLVTTEDTMRIKDFTIHDLGRNTVAQPDGGGLDLYQVRIVAQVKPLYAGIGSDTLCLDSEHPITVIERKAGDLSRDLWASTQGKFIARPGTTSLFAAGPSARMPVKSYSLSLPLDEIGVCPTTKQPFLMKHVCKYGFKGAYRFTIDGAAGEPITTPGQQHAFLGALKDLASTAIGTVFGVLADSAMTAGNAQYRIPDETQVAVTVKETLALLPKLKPRQELVATADQSRVAGVDSLDYYTADALRTDLLFPEFQGKLAEPFNRLLADERIKDLVARVRMQPALDAVKVDTVGLAVYSPITGEEKYQRGLKRLFEVKPPENHGYIYNGTKSWE